MKVILNKFLPLRGFKAINLFGILFQREGTGKMSSSDYNHEAIHTAQMKELGYIFFYLFYIIEWIINLFRYGVKDQKAYRNLSYEKEAYKFQYDLDYLSRRKHYAQWRKGN